MSEQSFGTEGVSIESLAAQMLGLEDAPEQSQPSQQTQQGHPAWQEILSKVPEEYHNAIIPTLQDWDAGVSRRFQKIHDEYAPYKQFEDHDPDSIREALGVYDALNNDPAQTWETIGRAYGLSPQQVSQASSDDEDFDYDSLPRSIRDRLAKIDQHDQVLEYVSKQMLDSQASQQEAEEDAALDELLYELHEEYGDYDEDYVVGLIAGGVDPEEAVARFQQFTGQFQQPEPESHFPRVMSSGGGVPSSGMVDVNKLSSQDTQNLITELLRLSQNS